MNIKLTDYLRVLRIYISQTIFSLTSTQNTSCNFNSSSSKRKTVKHNYQLLLHSKLNNQLLKQNLCKAKIGLSATPRDVNRNTKDTI